MAFYLRGSESIIASVMQYCYTQGRASPLIQNPSAGNAVAVQPRGSTSGGLLFDVLAPGRPTSLTSLLLWANGVIEYGTFDFAEDYDELRTHHFDRVVNSGW